MRAALGKSRVRIIRQLLAESVLLCIADGSGGCWSAEVLVAFLSLNWFRPFRLDVAPNGRVVGFTLLTSILVGVLSGLASVGTRIGAVSTLNESESSTGGGARRAWLTPSKALIVLQTALGAC
jgi:hypothetical protein